MCSSDEPVRGGGGGSGNGSSPNVPATQTVPDFWPKIPVIAVNRHPVFPKVCNLGCVMIDVVMGKGIQLGLEPEILNTAYTSCRPTILSSS